MTATVHNMKSERMQVGDVRIDRRTIHGNPYRVGLDGSREFVIGLFEKDLREKIKRDPFYRQEVKNLHNRRLFCWCYPQACHGDVLARVAEELSV